MTLPIRRLLAALCLAVAPLVIAADQSLAGLAAPALTFKDLDGQKVRLADFRGKVVVVDFWATWCAPCVAEIPGYIELQRKYGKDGLVIVGVSLDSLKPVAVKKFVEKKGMNYTVVMGTADDVDAFTGKPGGDLMIPTTFLINREGRVVHQKSGAMDHAAYEEIVKKAL